MDIIAGDASVAGQSPRNIINGDFSRAHFSGSVETGMNGSSHPNHENCEGTTAIRNKAS